MPQLSGDLWNMSFANWPGILLALIPAVLNLFIFFFIMFRMPNRAVPRSFGLFTLALIFWQLDDSFGRMSLNANTASNWDNILSVGWIALGPVGVYFSMLYTGRKHIANNNLILLSLILPAVFFEAYYSGNVYAELFTYSGIWGWVNEHDHTIIEILMIYWIAYQVVIMTTLLGMHAYKVRNNKLAKNQALIIAVSLAIPALQGIITQVVMPLVFGKPAIPVTTTFMTCFSLGTAIAFSKFKLFGIWDEVQTEALLESMGDMVFTVSNEKKITYVNPYAAMVLGVDKSEIDKFSLKELFPKEKDIDYYNQFVNGVIKPSFHGLHVESFYSTFRNKEGQEIAVLVTSDPIGDEYNIHGVLIVAHNITEMKRAEARISEKNRELERSNAELETFAFVASHDMKEPLRMVSNYTQLLAHKYENKLDAEAKEFIHYAVDGVHRMQALINDLLNYARIGKTNLPEEPVDCNKLLQHVINTLDAEIKEKRATVYVKSMPVVNGVYTQLQQLFQNLIGNAIKFHSEKKPEVYIDAAENATEWLFSVRDNGIGIDEEYKEKVFVLFQRLHERSQYPGTGIGLSICRKIVELHSGNIWIESEPGKGSVFYFTLPK
ncbi:MAG: ATP-binding protein [Bacteroidia bacterium]